MPRPLTVRKPHRAEIDYLNTALEQELTTGHRRRAEVLVLYAAGLEGTDIARTLAVHVNTVYTDVKAFERYGLDCVHHRLRGGASVRIAEAKRAEILCLAEMPSGEVGLPYGRWSLSKLRQYLLAHRIVPTISREHLRQVIKKRGVARSLHRTQTDQPRSSTSGYSGVYPIALATVTALLFFCGVLLYFDEPPIVVKAYGGRR